MGEPRVRVPIARPSVKPLIDALLVNGRDAIVTVDGDGTICYVSAGATLLLGYDAETSVGTSVLSYVHPDDSGCDGENAAASTRPRR